MSRFEKTRRGPRGRLMLGAVTMVLAVGVLSACSGAPVSVQAATASSLQASVLDISTAAASGDFDTALGLLTAVEADLRTAAAAGQVSPERSAQIQSAISAVNSDLLAAIADAEPEPTATRTPSPTPTPDRSETPTPTPTPTEDDEDEEPGNSGNSDNSDKDDKSDKDNKDSACDADEDDDGICDEDE